MVPLSLIDTHFVGFPATGAFNSVPAAAPAPFASATLEDMSVDVETTNAGMVKAPAASTPPTAAPLIANSIADPVKDKVWNDTNPVLSVPAIDADVAVVENRTAFVVPATNNPNCASLVLTCNTLVGAFVPNPNRLLLLSQNKFALSCPRTPAAVANGTDPGVNPPLGPTSAPPDFHGDETITLI